MIKELIMLITGWRKCEFPNWFKGIYRKEGKDFEFNSKTFMYKAIYTGNYESLGSSESRIMSAYKVFRKLKKN